MQVCHSEQKSGKAHRRLGQSLKQKQSLDFVDSYCSQRPELISRELKLPGLCAMTCLVSLQVPGGQTHLHLVLSPLDPK